MMRRLTLLALSAVLFVIGSASVVMADELTDHLSGGVGVAYSGEQSVVCDQPDGRHSEVFDVGQNNLGITVTVNPAGTTRAAKSEMESAVLGPQYGVRSASRGEVLGRPVDVIEVVEGNLVRIRLSFDVESSVLLMSEIFNGDGTTYCTTRFIEFALGSSGPATGVTSVEAPDLDEKGPSGNVDLALPPRLAGFNRLQLSTGSQPEVASAFYGDGVFTFQLTNSVRSIKVPELDNQPWVTVEGRQYQRIFELGRVVYVWNSDLGGYVLVGELPVDLQIRVLSELPDPHSRGFFQKLWYGLFG